MNYAYFFFIYHIFSPNSQNFAYLVIESGKYFIVFNNQEGKKYDDVYDFTFSPNSQHFAYLAKESGKYFVVFNNQEVKKYDGIFYYYFLNNNTLIYFAKENNNILKITSEF